MVLPVKLLKEVKTIISLYEIHIGLEEISAMDAELILFTMIDYRGMLLIRRCLLVLQLFTFLIVFILCVV